MPARILLVVAIDHNSGAYRNGWFRVKSYHTKKPVAQKRAIKLRRDGYLARVRRKAGGYVVAVRRPRKINPARHHLEVV